MALSEFETKKVKKMVAQFVEKHRPPQNIRNKLDLAFRVEGQSVEIFEVRPVWREPAKKMECAVAKATCVKTQRIWKVFWQRADLKWHVGAVVALVASLSANVLLHWSEPIDVLDAPQEQVAGLTPAESAGLRPRVGRRYLPFAVLRCG